MHNNNIPLSEYPRPQLVRDSYRSLNGVWEYKITRVKDLPETYDGEILVPYSPECPLSVVNKLVTPKDYLFYRRYFDITDDINNDKIILHFTAVDQIAEVFINGQFIGEHIGGFLPFSFDIKPYVKEKDNELIVRVKDYSDTSHYSRGKQKLKRGKIWYSAQSGIYLPVWLEGVSNDYVESIKLTPNIDTETLEITVKSQAKSCKLHFFGKEIEIPTNEIYTLSVPSLNLWTPDNPFLYDFEISTKKDHVKSYFAMRKFSVMRDKNNIPRLALNNKPLFMKGLLDQGYYDKGWLTPRNEDDYVKDILLCKQLGYNVLRKHIKIETLRWYYHCDRLGVIVWQDFVNGGSSYNWWIIQTPLITHLKMKDKRYFWLGRRSKIGKQLALQEYKDTIEYLYNVPSLGLWTIFNEGWGQFDSKIVYDEMLKLDNTRPYDHASGWYDQGISDVCSLHIYLQDVFIPKPKQLKDRCLIVSECGGNTLPIEGHMFSDQVVGIKKYLTKEDWMNEYKRFIKEEIISNIPKGLSAFIYTQLSDVEDEVNGLITYDRQVLKFDIDEMKQINDKIHL